MVWINNILFLIFLYRDLDMIYTMTFSILKYDEEGDALLEIWRNKFTGEKSEQTEA